MLRGTWSGLALLLAVGSGSAHAREGGTGAGVPPRIEVTSIAVTSEDAGEVAYAVEVEADPGTTHDYAGVRTELHVDDRVLPRACESNGRARCIFEVSLEDGVHELQAVLTLLEDGEPTAGFVSAVHPVHVESAEAHTTEPSSDVRLGERAAHESASGCSVGRDGRRSAWTWLGALLVVGGLLGRRTSPRR